MATAGGGFRGLRETMEQCSEIVTDAYSIPIEELQIYTGELPPGHRSTDRRQRFMVTEHNGDLVVALPGTTHPLDWSSNLRVDYTPVDGSAPPPDTTTEQLEQVPCAHAGFFYRAETVPTLQLLQQAADKGCRLVLTGHSLGGAVANLCALTALTAQRRALEAAASRAAPAAQASGRRRRKSRAKAALRSISGSVASANTSCCSGNGDVHISAQAALVEVLCVSFASPLYANAALAQLIADSGWDDCFVNVVVPEDYCLKLFNNVLTSAPQPDGIVRTASSNSFKATKQQLEYAEILDDPFDRDPLPESPMADPFELVAAMPFKQATAGSSSCSSMDSCGGGARRFSYQGSSQPLASALAGKRSSKPMRSRRQLSFAQPVHQHVADGGCESGAESTSPDLSGAAGEAAPPAASAPAAAGAAKAVAAEDESVMMRLPAIACCPQDIRLCQEEPGSNWSHVPSSPSAASLLSESSWSSTRSWRLLAYLPEALSRSLSGSTRSLSSMDGSTSSRAGSTTPSESGTAAAAAPAAAAPSGSAAAGARQGTAALRHAHSSVELSRPQQEQPGLATSSSSSSLCSLEDLQASNVVAGMAAEQPDASSRQQQQQQHTASARSSLRRSLSSASLTLLQPLSSVSSLLPTMRAVRAVSRRALHAATAVAERAFSIPLDVLEVGLVKALQPPMYTPVGQQWVLSATGLVPQNQPIAQYPRHVHDVFWHKELMMVAFREHSIVFYKQRLLQQARRR